MRIAFISYEAPPDTLVGGIGTYVGQAAKTLAARGHDVEVFTASARPAERLHVNGYVTHLIPCDLTFEGRLGFGRLAGETFARHHAEKPFQVLEGPDFLAEAAGARKLVPDIPLVVKLHMSLTLIHQLNHRPASPWKKAKERIKGVMQPMLQLKRWEEFNFAALELPHLLEADEISAPCREIADITAGMWNLDRAQMFEVPYPFTPSPELLEIPVETQTNTVGFIGRLEQRKGVLDLATAIPLILERFPKTHFFFAGAPEASPVSGVNMQEYLTKQLSPFKNQVAFLGRIPASQMGDIFRRMDICVLPSLWENFPNACLEAMAAGRGVVGGSAGGMAQQLNGGEAGLLVPPQNPQAIAATVCRLLENPCLRMELGHKARARVLSEYNPDRIGQLMEQSYARAIRQRKSGGRQWLDSPKMLTVFYPGKERRLGEVLSK
jgi:glycosyltransferase involved in cell wall biosynthesis